MSSAPHTLMWIFGILTRCLAEICLSGFWMSFYCTKCGMCLVRMQKFYIVCERNGSCLCVCIYNCVTFPHSHFSWSKRLFSDRLLPFRFRFMCGQGSTMVENSCVIMSTHSVSHVQIQGTVQTQVPWYWYFNWSITEWMWVNISTKIQWKPISATK